MDLMKQKEIIRWEGQYRESGGGLRYKEIANHIKCVDGTTLSVHASKLHYCRPRSDFGPYSHVEVSCLSVDPPETWARYADGDYPNAVYGYVPIELVEAYIESHCGEADG